MEGMAVASRMAELKNAIETAEHELVGVSTQVDATREGLAERLVALEQKHLAAMAEKEKEHEAELEVDTSLTQVFTDRAQEAVIETVLKQQDGVLEPEYLAYREQLLEAAVKELDRREEALKSGQAEELQAAMAAEEAAFQSRIKRIVHAHEERMRQLSHHDDHQ